MTKATTSLSVMLMQASFVLKNLDVERPGCGYAKLAAACERSALGDRPGLPVLPWKGCRHEGAEHGWDAETAFGTLYSVRGKDCSYGASHAGQEIGETFSSPDEAREFCQTDYMLRALTALCSETIADLSRNASDPEPVMVSAGP